MSHGSVFRWRCIGVYLCIITNPYNMPAINLYVAVEEMRRISTAGGTFSITFRKYNRQTGKGGDAVTIKAARVRPAASAEKVADADYKLFLTDTETGQAFNCWQPLVMQFNGQPVILT